MHKFKNIKMYLFISNILLFFVFLALAIFGVGDLDWDKAKHKVHKYFVS